MKWPKYWIIFRKHFCNIIPTFPYFYRFKITSQIPNVIAKIPPNLVAFHPLPITFALLRTRKPKSIKLKHHSFIKNNSRKNKFYLFPETPNNRWGLLWLGRKYTAGWTGANDRRSRVNIQYTIDRRSSNFNWRFYRSFYWHATRSSEKGESLFHDSEFIVVPENVHQKKLI